MNNNRGLQKQKDAIIRSIIYLLGSLGAVVLGAIIWYVLSNGFRLVNLDLILGDSRTINTDVFVEVGPGNYPDPNYNGELELFYSERWGLGFVNTFNRAGNAAVEIGYVHPDSPFNESLDKNNFDEDGLNQIIRVRSGTTVEKGFTDSDVFLGRFGAERIATIVDQGNTIREISIQTRGGGIRGSLITTLYLIGMTLVIAVPIGVSTAIYFNEIARRNRFTNLIRSMVDLLVGVPSIIYGLLGAALFIPLLNNTINTAGGSVISGALTLSVILLPTIIKNTEEALKVIPNDLRNASLAIGASQTQTIFKVVLPSAVPGILTGVLLGIGRIIGESAALIFAVGAAIKDDIILTERSTSLAVHIWTIMGGERPNFELASAIAIIILGVVFVINFLVKLLAKKLSKAIY
jgi:phosphate transport system permease protein